MHVRDWLRPPRQLVLVFVIVALASTGVLGWLTWQLIALDRAAARQRTLDDLERAADTAVAVLQRELSALEQHLDRFSASNDALPRGTLVLRLGHDFVSVSPSGALLYQPTWRSPSLPSHRTLEQAQRFELVERNLPEAIRLYESVTRAEPAAFAAIGLNRLGRVHRGSGNHAAALAAYDRLARLGNVDVEGIPAGVVARIGRIETFEMSGRATDARAEAETLETEFLSGRHAVTAAQYRYYRAEAARRLSRPETPDDADAIARAEAVRWLWEHRNSPPASGRRVLSGADGGALVSWRHDPPRLLALVIDRGGLSDLVASAVPPEFLWSLSDLAGDAVIGEAPPSRQMALRSAAATTLPWTLHVFPNPDRTVDVTSPRERLLRLVLAGVACLLAAGWYFIWRGVSREVRAARLQSDFVAAVSHEFRSPLTSLRHIADLLTSDRMPSEDRRRRAYALLASETDRLSRLVEGLLEFAQLQAGRITLHRTPLDISNVVATVVNDFRRGLDPAHGHILEFTDATSGTTVLADGEALSRAVWNLLDNAVKYSPGSARVAVRVGQAPGGHVTVSVQDQGPGIPAGERHRIFERFVRGDDAKAQRIKGTGIGLAIVREIVVAHGGRVDVESEPGRGSTFCIVLPVVATTTETAKDRSAPLEPPATDVPAPERS